MNEDSREMWLAIRALAAAAQSMGAFGSTLDKIASVRATADEKLSAWEPSGAASGKTEP